MHLVAPRAARGTLQRPMKPLAPLTSTRLARHHTPSGLEQRIGGVARGDDRGLQGPVEWRTRDRSSENRGAIPAHARTEIM